MKRLILTVAIVMTLPSVASATCPCVQKSVGEKFGNANTVFQGIMTSVEELPGQTRTERITFQLDESWKGTGNPREEVIFPVSVDACGLPEEEIGRSYLVYARAQSNGELVSTMCDGTDLADMLQADIRILNQIYHPDRSHSDDRFSDLPTTYPYSQSIRAFREKEIIQGFPDGTFRADWPVTRAELTKILSKTLLPYDSDRETDTYAFTDTDLPFKDLEQSAWYNLYVRRAYRSGIVKGFADRTFRPNQSVTVAEAFAMIVRGMSIETGGDTGIWYEPYVRALGERNALLTDISDLTQPITRAQVVEILWRLSENVIDRDSLSAEDLLLKTCVSSEDPILPGVDLRRVRSAWISLYNEERVRRGLTPYALSQELNRTAAIWSKESARLGTMSHKRNGASAYYDYREIQQWFTDLGLTFDNVKSQTFTESIGVGPYRCSDADCTDDLIAAIHQSFAFYLSEESREYRPHFNAIVNPSFTMLGVGVSVRDGQYFLTTHFGTRFSVTPSRLCSASQ